MGRLWSVNIRPRAQKKGEAPHSSDQDPRRPQIPIQTKFKFLQSRKNKEELIHHLTKYISNETTTCISHRDDADGETVGQALDQALTGSVQVLGEDTDLLVLLVHHFKPHQHFDVYLTNSSNESFSIERIKAALTPYQLKSLLLIHAFTGCDTVSRIYGHSKSDVFDKLCDNVNVHPFLSRYINEYTGH